MNAGADPRLYPLAPLPSECLDLFTKRTIAHLATVMPDGTPHVTPVWVDTDGAHVLVNSAWGRVKVRNMLARPRVGIELLDPDDGLRYLSIQGRVAGVVDGPAAEEQFDRLAQRYMGLAHYPAERRPSGQRRVVVLVAPERLHVG